MTAAILLAAALTGGEEAKAPATVRVGAYIINLGKFDLASGSYTVDFYLTFESHGDLPPGYNTDKASEMAFEFINGRASNVERIKSAPNRAEYRILANLYVPIDLRRYPFDRQALVIQIEDKRQSNVLLEYVPSPKDTGLDPEVVVIGWDVAAVRERTRVHAYPDNENYHQYVLSLDLKRSGITAVLKVFIPLVCFLTVSFITLMLAPESYDKRLGTNTGMLIASVMFHVAIISSLPPLGYLTLADRVVMATYVTVGFHVLQCVRMMRLWMKGAKDEAQKVHATSRWAVPLVAIVSYPVAVLSVFGL
ncbi:MAG: hypothetical protein HYY17_11180 [Planctomycetes bacterium]|nr:hypothetical protein [Planctomycetota bacterium]